MFFYDITVTGCVSVMAKSLCLCGFNAAGSKKAEIQFWRNINLWNTAAAWQNREMVVLYLI